MKNKNTLTAILLGALAASFFASSPLWAQNLPAQPWMIESLNGEQAAELWSKYKTIHLCLNGLKSIDNDVAQELGKGTGILLLNGLTSINKDIARELAKNKRTLALRSLTSIDKEIAQELANFDGELLCLSGLNSINKDVAQELAKVKGSLDLNGLTSVDKDVAQELAKFEGELLCCSGLKAIDKNVAQEFANFKGLRLTLRPLQSIKIEDDDREVLLQNNKIRTGRTICEAVMVVPTEQCL